ncbi:hypothetical protein BX661DRAFT_177106 [Kickxella alabastrina]|uniref:uncharacterized protein n=1 Tax=Kickxella alabastrina TaxID=61397 RepID=UPI00221E78FB|nr:uncharacterized protein BX661DRAFT_177106 [Kickxella alabastrina]KAI7834381.1 hypothetical protein BX661DRAFT_177106 [Kickxella alabastrina]
MLFLCLHAFPLLAYFSSASILFLCFHTFPLRLATTLFTYVRWYCRHVYLSICLYEPLSFLFLLA